MKRILAPNPWRIIIAILVTLSVSNSNGTDTESASISSAFNHTEFMINHLWSKGNTTRERNHRNRPDPVEETSTQSSSAAEAEDRTFFKPYQFPFWGLHYGIPSPSGFFNPGAFPFVPRGPGFQPFDGIFGSPIGPGKFPSGRPIPVQGPSDSSLSTRTAASTLTSSTSTSAPSPEDTNTSNDSPTEGRTKRYPRAPGYRRKKRRRRPCCYTTTTPAPDEDDHYYPEESDEDQPSGYYDYHNYETVMKQPNYPKYMATEPPAPPHSYQRPHTEYHHAYKQHQRPSPSYDTDHGPHAYSIPMTPPRPKYRNAPGQSPPKYRSRPPPYKMRRPPPTYDQPPEKTKKRPPSNSQWYRSRPKPPPPDHPSMYSPEDIPSPYDEEQHDSYSHSNDHPKPYYPSYWNHVSMSQTSTTTAPSTSPVPHNLGSSPVILNVSPCQLYTIFPNLLSPNCDTSTTSSTTPKSTTVTYVNDRSDSSSTITISLPYQHWLYSPPWYTTLRPQYSIPPSLLDNVTPPPQYATPPPHQTVYPVLPPLLQYVLPSPMYATPPVSPTIPGPPSAPQLYPGYYSLPTPEVTSTTTPSPPQPLYVVLPPGVAPPSQNAKPVYIQQASPPTPNSEKDLKPQQIIYPTPSLQSIYYMYPPEVRTTSPAPPTTTEKPQSQPVYIIYAPPPPSESPPPPEQIPVKSEPTITPPPVQPVYVMYHPQATPQTVTPPPQIVETTTPPQSVDSSPSPQHIYVIYAPPPTSSSSHISTPPVPEPSTQPVRAKSASSDPSPQSGQHFYYAYDPPTTTESSLPTSYTFNKPPPLSNYPMPQAKSPITDTYLNPKTRPRQPVYFMYPKITSPPPTSSVTPPQSEHFESPPQIPPEFAYGDHSEFSDEEPALQQTEDVPPYQFTYSSPTHRFIYSMPAKSTLDTPRQTPTVGTPPETIYVRPTPKKSTYDSLYLPHFTSPVTPLPDSNPRDTQFPPGYDNIQNFQGTSQSKLIETPPSPPYEPPDPDIYPRYDVHNFDSPAPSSLNQESIPPPYRAYGGSRVKSHIRTQPYLYPNPSKKSTNHVSIVYPERHSPSNSYSRYPKSLYSRDSRSYTSASGTVIDNGATSTFYQDPIPSESRSYPGYPSRRVKPRVLGFDAEEKTGDHDHSVNSADPRPLVVGGNIYPAPNSNVFHSGGLGVKNHNDSIDSTLQIEALSKNSTVHANAKSLSSPDDDPDSEGYIVSNYSTNTDTSTEFKPRASETPTPKATTSLTEKPSNAHQYNLNS